MDEILFVGKILEKLATFTRTSIHSVQRHCFICLQRLTIGELFGQTPKSLVQVDLGINAAQCPHRTWSPTLITPELRHHSANQGFPNGERRRLAKRNAVQ